MFQSEFQYTDKVVSSLIKSEHHKTILQTLDLNYPTRQRLALQTKTYDMFHLAHILGLEITLKESEKLATGMKLENIDDIRSRILSNFRNVLEFNRSNMADTYAEIDFTIIMHLHKLIISGWKETWEARFRNISDNVDTVADSWVNLRDTNIDGGQVENEISSLIDWYKNVSPIMPPIVRIGIFIFRVLEIYPFVAGNKLTIMALTDYLLLKNNLSSKVFMSVTRIFDLHEQRLLEGYQYSRKDHQLSYWIEAFISVISRDLNDVREGISEFIKEDEKSKSQPFLDLNKRQLKVLRYLQTVPVIKREDYCHMMEVSTMTAFRDLNDLVRKKLIRIEGQGRGTKYRLASM